MGYKLVHNEKKINLDSQLANGNGPSFGFVVPNHFLSLTVTKFIDYQYSYINFFDDEQQDGSISRTKTNTTYTGKNAWFIDLNIILGNGWFRFDPGLSYLTFNYNRLQFESTPLGANSAASPTSRQLQLEQGTWKDSWVSPYLRLSIII